MALQHLLDAIERQVEREADGILEAGRTEAARVAAEASERRSRRRAEWLARAQASARLELETDLLKARRHAEERILEARQRFLGRAFLALEALLDEAVGSDLYGEVLPRHLEESLAYLGEDPAVVRCSPGMAVRLRSLLGERAQLSVEEDPTVPAGFRLISADGRLLVDNTLRSRLASRWPSIAIELMRRVEAIA